MVSRTLRMLVGLGFVAAFAPCSLFGITWDGNGDANNSGNWSGTTNWNPDGSPAGQTIVLPTVTGIGNSATTTRTITVDGNYTFNGLSITQANAGFTNRLLFNGSLNTSGSGAISLTVSNGSLVLDKGSYDLIFTYSTSLTLPAGTTLNSTGGTIARSWNGGTAGNITNAGAINLTTGTTNFLYGGAGDLFTNQGSIDISSNAVLNVRDPFTNQGTITSDGTGTIIVLGTVHMLPGTVMTAAPASITTSNWDFQVTDPTAVNMSGMTLSARNTGGTQTIEAATNTAGRYLIGKLIVTGAGTVTQLVNNYNNDPSSLAPESMEVNSLQFGGSNVGILDLNGLNMKVNTGVALSPYQRQLCNQLAGSTSVLSFGPGVDLGSIMNGDFNGTLSLFVTNGAALTLSQTVPVSYLNIEAGNGRINVGSGSAAANNGGIHAYAANGKAWAATDVLTVDFNGGTYTLNNGANAYVENGATLKLLGNVQNNSGSVGYGVIAAGTSVLEISGAYAGDSRGRIQIDSGATLRIAGSVLPLNWWNGLYGAGSDSNAFWQINTGATPGVFTLNGGGPVQQLEILSRDYSVSGSALASGYSATFSRLPFGTLNVGDPAGAPASVQLVNNVKNNDAIGSTETMQVARNLAVTAGSTLDLNGYQMTVALGSATVKGLVTDTYGVGRTSTLLLAENASLTVDGGTVSVDQLTLNAGSNLSLVGGATLSNTAFTLAGTNTVTNTSGTNTIANSVTLNGPVILSASAGTLNITGALGGAGGSVTKTGPGIAVYGSTANYGGTTAINGGVLRISGAYSGGAITVNSGGTLGGTGPISSPINMAGGTINPGASPGTLTVNNAAVNFGSGGTLAIEIAGLGAGQYDVLNITGTGSLNLSGSNDVLDLYIQNPYYSHVGDTLTFVTSPSILGSFDTLRLFGGAWPGAYTVSYPGGNTAQIQFLISIPEPGTLLLGGLGTLLLLRRRRRVPATA